MFSFIYGAMLLNFCKTISLKKKPLWVRGESDQDQKRISCIYIKGYIVKNGI